MDTISSQPLPNVAPFGIQAKRYFLDNQELDYPSIVSNAAFFQVSSFEREGKAVSEMVRVRMKKLEDLGQVMSVLSETNAQFPVKKPKSNHETTNSRLSNARNTAELYNLEIGGSGNTIKRGDCQRAQTNIQYAMDQEDNNLQQDMLSLQSIMSKRDNAFSAASKLMNKALNPAKSIIANMG